MSRLSSKLVVLVPSILNRDVDKAATPFDKLVETWFEAIIPGPRTEVIHPRPEPRRATQRRGEHSESKTLMKLFAGIQNVVEYGSTLTERCMRARQSCLEKANEFAFFGITIV